VAPRFRTARRQATEWRSYRSPTLGPAANGKTRNLRDKGKALLREVLSKGGDVTTELEVGVAPTGKLPWSTPVLTELHGQARANVLAWAARRPMARAG
jgi:hypothetical protein